MRDEQPFIRKYAFLADIVGTIAVRRVELTLYVGYSKRPEIRAHISCSPDIGIKLEALSFEHDIHIISSEPDATGYEFKSDKFIFGERSFYKITENVGKTDIELIFEELQLTKTYDDNPLNNIREIFFYISGPKDAWPLREMRHHEPFGTVTSELFHSEFDLGIDGVHVEVKPRYFYDMSGPQEIVSKTYTIHYKTERTDISDSDFIDQMVRATDDVLFLISFNSKRASVWFKYEAYCGRNKIEFYNNSYEESKRPLHIADLIIEHRHIYEYLKCGFSHLQFYREKNIDIFTPIWYYITTAEYRFVNEQFPILFLGLEKLKDIYAKSCNLLATIDEKQFDVLCIGLKKKIKESFPDDKEIRKSLYGKLRELNRPSMTSVLDKMLNYYSISRLDLYPTGADFTLIKTRDKMFHSADMVDSDLLFKEYSRLEALMERLLLRLLGWRDFSRSPQAVILKDINQH